MEPLDTIRRQVEANGPIPFADYMAAALYGPDGFYERHPVGSEAGSDFVTSPHVSPVFAQLLARQLERISGRGHVRLAELGAGDGTLGSQLRDVLGDRLDYSGVDISSGAIDSMQRKGLRTATLSDAVPQGWDGAVLAHELFDNLPFHWIRRSEGVFEDVMVGLADDGSLAYTTRPCPDGIAALAPDLGEGEEGTVPTAAHELLSTLAQRLAPTARVLIIDYASSGAPWGYRSHSRTDDLLEAPGSRDITAGLDFEALTRFAGDLGFETDGVATQRDALLDLGYASVDEELRKAQAQAQDEGRSREAIGVWNARRAGASLLDPGGLGAHGWLTLRSPPASVP